PRVDRPPTPNEGESPAPLETGPSPERARRAVWFSADGRNRRAGRAELATPPEGQLPLFLLPDVLGEARRDLRGQLHGRSGRAGESTSDLAPACRERRFEPDEAPDQ